MIVGVQILALDTLVADIPSTTGSDFDLGDSYRSNPVSTSWSDLGDSHCLGLSHSFYINVCTEPFSAASSVTSEYNLTVRPNYVPLTHTHTHTHTQWSVIIIIVSSVLGNTESDSDTH